MAHAWNDSDTVRMVIIHVGWMREGIISFGDTEEYNPSAWLTSIILGSYITISGFHPSCSMRIMVF